MTVEKPVQADQTVMVSSASASENEEGSSIPAAEVAVAPIKPDEALSTANRILIVASIGVVVFMGSLDSSLVATLNPTLIAAFHSGKDFGWYGSIFLIAVGATLPVFGKLMTIFQPKSVFLTALVILEIGCLICALSHNSPTFILGRAFAGLGCAGLLSGGLTITAVITPLRQRPMFTAIIGSLEGIASAVGPTIGGVIADTIGWRWAFWINLPVGGVLFAVLFFFFHPPPREPVKDENGNVKTTKEKLLQLDFVGAIGIIGCIICLLLALQLGGATYPWNDGRIIALFVIFGVSFVVIGWYERRKGDAAIFPTRLLRSRKLCASLWFGFGISSAQWIIIYYLPLWFQAVQRTSAEGAGIRVIPMALAQVIIASLAAVGTSALGYLPPFVMASTIFSSIGCGLCYTLTEQTPEARWIGYQIILGAGFGIGIEQSIVNAQVSVDAADVGFGTTTVLLGNIIGGSVFISVADAVFSNEVLALAKEFPSVSSDTLTNDISALGGLLSPADLQLAIHGYNTGLGRAFLIAAGLSVVSCLAWPFTPWQSIKSKEKKEEDVEEAGNEPETKKNTAAGVEGEAVVEIDNVDRKQ